jgi:bifunctional non-homologous end joining protein LigD
MGERSAVPVGPARTGDDPARWDQLSLALQPVLPAPPESLRPMLPRPAATAFDSTEHLFEPHWDGRRALAFLEPAVTETSGGAFVTAGGSPSVRLLDDGRDLAPRLPELAGLALRLDGTSAVLDGELVVVDRTGRADPAALERRLSGGLGRPVAYLVFDLLYLDGRLLLSWPLARRRRELARVVRSGPEVVVVPVTVGEGRALHAAVAAQGVGGVLARVRSSPYLPGVRSRLWRTIAAESAAAPAGDEAGPVRAESEPIEPASANAPVLAVIERLPLLDDLGEPG